MSDNEFEETASPMSDEESDFDSDDETFDKKWFRFTERLPSRFKQVLKVADSTGAIGSTFFSYFECDDPYSKMSPFKTKPYAEQNKQFNNTCYDIMHFNNKTLIPIGLQLTPTGEGAKYYCVLPPPHDGNTRGLAVTMKRKFNVDKKIVAEAQAHFATYTIDAFDQVTIDDPADKSVDVSSLNIDEEDVCNHRNRMTVKISFPYGVKGMNLTVPAVPRVPFGAYKTMLENRRKRNAAAKKEDVKADDADADAKKSDAIEKAAIEKYAASKKAAADAAAAEAAAAAVAAADEAAKEAENARQRKIELQQREEALRREEARRQQEEEEKRQEEIRLREAAAAKELAAAKKALDDAKKEAERVVVKQTEKKATPKKSSMPVIEESSDAATDEIALDEVKKQRRREATKRRREQKGGGGNADDEFTLDSDTFNAAASVLVPQHLAEADVKRARVARGVDALPPNVLMREVPAKNGRVRRILEYEVDPTLDNTKIAAGEILPTFGRMVQHAQYLENTNQLPALFLPTQRCYGDFAGEVRGELATLIFSMGLKTLVPELIDPAAKLHNKELLDDLRQQLASSND